MEKRSMTCPSDLCGWFQELQSSNEIFSPPLVVLAADEGDEKSRPRMDGLYRKKDSGGRCWQFSIGLPKFMSRHTLSYSSLPSETFDSSESSVSSTQPCLYDQLMRSLYFLSFRISPRV